MNQTPLHELWEPGFLPTTSLVSTADDCVLPLPGLAGTRLPVIQFVRVMMQTFHVADAISAGATLQCSQSWRQLLSEHSGFLPGYGYGCVFLEEATVLKHGFRIHSLRTQVMDGFLGPSGL